MAGISVRVKGIEGPPAKRRPQAPWSSSRERRGGRLSTKGIGLLPGSHQRGHKDQVEYIRVPLKERMPETHLKIAEAQRKETSGDVTVHISGQTVPNLLAHKGVLGACKGAGRDRVGPWLGYFRKAKSGKRWLKTTKRGHFHSVPLFQHRPVILSLVTQYSGSSALTCVCNMTHI